MARSTNSAPSRILPPEDRPVKIPEFRVEKIDALALALVLGFALLMIIRTGFIHGQELWPTPDAIEYAAMAVNMDRGLGPVLHFGGHTYPPRYMIGYPLILAAAYPLVGHRPESLWVATTFMALVAIAGLYIFALWAFDRPSAIAAAVLLSTSPYFLGLSPTVMSDVPSVAVLGVAAVAFLYAAGKESVIASALCGIFTGFAMAIRVTNGAILLGMLAAVLLVEPRRLRLGQLIAFAIGLTAFPGLQAWENFRFFGSPFSSGYAFWLPLDYKSFSRTFDPRLLFMPVDPAFRHGHLFYYGFALLGLDGLFGQIDLNAEAGTLAHSHYAFYPFPVALFAVMGAFFVLRHTHNANARRAIFLSSGFLAASLIVYVLYFYTDPRFLIPASFVVMATAAYGLVNANRAFDRGWKRFAVLGLDVILGVAIAVETVTRIATPAAPSKLVPEVIAMQPVLKNSVVVSDLSLQWLEVFLHDEGIDFVSLTDLYAGELHGEYHLFFLNENKSANSSVPLPHVLLPSGKVDFSEALRLAKEDKSGRPVYLLVAMPMTDEWTARLTHMFAEIDRYFSHEAVVDLPEVGLYRLKPR